MTRTKLLMGASALVAAMAGAASAQNTPPPLTSPASTGIYGAGSSLIAPYLNQAESCYGTPSDLIAQGSSPYTSGETDVTPQPFTYTGTPTADDRTCPTSNLAPTDEFFYLSTGSGNGVNGFFSQDAQLYWGDYTIGTDPSYFPGVQYAAGDYGLPYGDVEIFDAGGGPNSDVKKCFAGTNSCSSGSVFFTFTPEALYGQMIQIPISIDPVAIVYSPTYKKITNAAGTVTTSYVFNIHRPNADGSGGLLLDMNTVCAIFNGAITNWNDPALKALNDNISLQDPEDPAGAANWSSVGLPIELVGRSDGSGTTSIFYRALAAQCAGGAGAGTVVTYTEGGDNYTYTAQYGTGGSHNLPNNLNSGQVYTVGNPNVGVGDSIVPVSGKFTTSSLSSGVATYVDFSVSPPAGSTYTQGRIGYVGTDYVLPEASRTTGNSYGLNLVDIKVGTVSIEPTQANALKAFGAGTTALLPPQSLTSGAYTTAPTGLSYGVRSAPEDWAEPGSTTWVLSVTAGLGDGATIPTPLANPTARGAYPIVGTTQGFFYTCYATAAETTAMTGFLDFYETNELVINSTKGLLVEDGLNVLPVAWRTAIVDTFVKPVTTGAYATNKLNLYILQGLTAGQPGSVATRGHPATPYIGPQCQTATGA